VKTISVIFLILLLSVFLTLLVQFPDAPSPARTTATTGGVATTSSSITTVVVPPSVKLGSLDSSYGVLRGNLSLNNPNNFSVADTEVVCDVIAATGTVIDRYRFTIFEMISANGSKTINRYQFGLWPQQANTLRCDGNKATKR
jgi:hypothetical protein